MQNILITNLSWNPFNWKDIYINPKAGHSYAREFPGHESVNFNFNKINIDNNKYIYGYTRWNYAPVEFQSGGLIIFYSKDTEKNVGKIIGLYGKTEIFKNNLSMKFKGFHLNKYTPNLKAEKAYSMLFPIHLNANDYKESAGKRLVGQNGFKYCDQFIAEQILTDEIHALSQSTLYSHEYNKLIKIYEFYFKKTFSDKIPTQDEREQNELVKYFGKGKTLKEIQSELNSTTASENDTVIVNHKVFKRDNKTIALIKIFRGLKCQICNSFIMKKDGTKYVEAAHIIPKHKKGKEVLDNILILCPNHHKEFDFGKLIINGRDSKYIDITLNGINYKLSLTV